MIIVAIEAVPSSLSRFVGIAIVPFTSTTIDADRFRHGRRAFF
jgi:hypothetical protein